MSTFVLLVIILLTWIIYLLYQQFEKKKRICDYLKDVRGPPPKPVIGNALDLGSNPVELLKRLTDIQNKYGNISKLFVGPNKVLLMISDPELIEVLLSSPKYLKKGNDYDMLAPWLMNGLLVSTGGYWQRRRKIITPTFHFKILDDFIPIFDSESEILVGNLTKVIGKDVDIYPFINAFTLDSICETAMGVKTNAQTSSNNDYVKAVKFMCNLYIKRKFSAWKSNEYLFRFSADYKMQNKALAIMHSFTRSVIEQRRQELALQNREKGSLVDDLGIKKKTAFLDLLLMSGEYLSDSDILEEVETFMFEGHDTTASTISFALYEIARNPDVQNKIIAEQDTIFESKEYKQISISNLNSMKYLESVIKETLRKYPAVPFFSRDLEEDVKFKDIIIPKGVTATILAYQMQNRDDIYKNPEQFIPERFSVKNKEKKNNFAFVPFSAGPRNCIGQKFALFEIKVVLSKILQNFTLSAADAKHNVLLSSEMILKSTNGVSIRLEKRKHCTNSKM